MFTAFNTKWNVLLLYILKYGLGDLGFSVIIKRVQS